MAFPVNNLVNQTSTGSGTGNLTLAAVTGYLTFNTVYGTGSVANQFYYFIVDSTNGAQEWGLGHMSASTTLVRDTILGPTAGSATNFAGGATLTIVNDLPGNLQASTGLAMLLSNYTTY